MRYNKYDESIEVDRKYAFGNYYIIIKYRGDTFCYRWVILNHNNKVLKRSSRLKLFEKIENAYLDALGEIEKWKK